MALNGLILDQRNNTSKNWRNILAEIMEDCLLYTSLHVVGRAISAASLVLCAGKSDITPSGVVMLHNVSMYGVSGDYHEMDKASEVLKKLNESIAIAYQEKTGKSRDELLEIMNRETWMHADDAVKAGIVDSITQGKRQFAAAYGSPLIPRSTIEKIRNTLKNPPDFQADFYMREKAQQQINILKIGGCLLYTSRCV